MKKTQIGAIAIIVSGVLIIALGVSGVVKGITGAGAGLLLAGAVLLGLSFIKPPVPTAEESPMTMMQMLIGIFYQPARVFNNLRSYPRWLAPLVVIALVSALYSSAAVARITPERIASFMSEKIAESGFIPPDKIEEMRDEQMKSLTTPAGRTAGVINSFVGTFFLIAIIAGLTMLMVVMFGGRINFWQAFSVAAFAALPVTLIQKLLSFVLLYVKDSADIHPLRGTVSLVVDNLGVLFNPATNPVMFAVGSMISLLMFYWVWLLATGLRHGGERVGGAAAWSGAIAFYVLLFIFSVGASALMPSFAG